jgi:hypothetical protein
MVTKMNDPINVVVSNYPTLAVYYDPEAEKREVFGLMALGKSAGSTEAEREFTERSIDAVTWRIRWTTQKAAKNEVLMGIYNFPTNNLLMVSFVETADSIKVPRLVLEKLEALYQEYLTNPDLKVHGHETRMDTLRPDFDLSLAA